MQWLLLLACMLAAFPGVATNPTWFAANVTATTGAVSSYTPVCMNLVSAWHSLKSPKKLGPPVWVALTNDLFQPVVISWVDSKGVEHPRTAVGSRCTAWFLASAEQLWRVRPMDPNIPPSPCDPSAGYMLAPAAVVSSVLLPKPPVTTAWAEFFVKAPFSTAGSAPKTKQQGGSSSGEGAVATNASTLLDGPAGHGHWVWTGIVSPCPGDAQRHHEGLDRLADGGAGDGGATKTTSDGAAGAGLQAAPSPSPAPSKGPSTLRPARLHPSLDAFSLSAIQGSISRRGFYACREELGARDVAKGCIVRTGGAVRAELDLSFKTLVGAVPLDPDAGLTMVVRLPIQSLMEPTVRKAIFNRTVPCPVCTAGLNISTATGVVDPPHGATRCERCLGTGTIRNVSGAPLDLPAVKKSSSKRGHAHHHHGHDDHEPEDEASHAHPPLDVLAAGYEVTRVCPSCLGWGYRTHTHCSRCDDTGIVEHLMVHDVVVPAGAPSEWMSMWPGLGGEKPFKKPGNLVAALDAFNLTLLRVGAQPFHGAPADLVAALHEPSPVPQAADTSGGQDANWQPPPDPASVPDTPPPPQTPVEGEGGEPEATGPAPPQPAANTTEQSAPSPGEPVEQPPLEPMPGYRGAALLRTMLDVDPLFRNGTFGPHLVALLQLSLFQATGGFVTEWELPSGQIIRLDRRAPDVTTPPWQIFVVPGAGLPVWFPACNWSTPCSVPADADARLDGKLCTNTTDEQLKGLLTASCPDYAPAWQALYADYARCESDLGYNATLRPASAFELHPHFLPPQPAPGTDQDEEAAAREAPSINGSELLELTPGGDATVAPLPSTNANLSTALFPLHNATATASNGSGNSTIVSVSPTNDTQTEVIEKPFTPRATPPRTPAPEERVTLLCAPSPRRAVHYYPHGHLFIVVRVLLPLMPGQTPGSTEELTDEEKVAVRGSIMRWADHQRAEAAAAAAAAAASGLDDDGDEDGSLTAGSEEDDATTPKDGDTTSGDAKKSKKARRLSRRRAGRRRRRFTGRRKKVTLPAPTPSGGPKSSRGKRVSPHHAASQPSEAGEGSEELSDAAVVEDDDEEEEAATAAAPEEAPSSEQVAAEPTAEPTPTLPPVQLKEEAA